MKGRPAIGQTSGGAVSVSTPLTQRWDTMVAVLATKTTPQILHEGDEPGVRAIGIGHQQHGRGSARRRAPDRGRARQDAHPGDRPAAERADAITERMMARKRSQLPEKVTRRSGLIEAAIIIASTT